MRMTRNRLTLALSLALVATLSARAHAETEAAASAEASADAGVSADAAADEPASGSAKTPQTLSTVTVTARRRAENVEKVPVAVSSFGEEQLRDLGARNLDGLQGAVPNLNIVQGRGSSFSVNAFIRGIGQPDALQTFDPGVGIYVDDVYYSRIQGALFGLFDVDHVEVLRGPQGTLYGKNSTGGAIKVVTREPGDKTEGSLEALVGDEGRVEGRLYAATSLSPTWSVSVAAAGYGDDGYVRDPVSHEQYNQNDAEAARVKLGWHPNADFHASFSVDYTHQDDPLTLGHPEAALVQTDLGRGAVVLRPIDNHRYDFRTRTSFPTDDGQQLRHRGAAANLAWNLDEAWTLKSITSYRRLNTRSFVDIDASEFQLGDVLVDLNQKQVSQELQLAYSNGSNLQATYGLYYLRETVPSHQEAYANSLLAFNGAPISFLRTIDDDLTTRSWAAFAHVNWEFVPTWTLAGGLRYTDEDKDYFRTTSTFSSLAALRGTFAFSRSDSWNATTPSISLSKQFDDNTMGYLSANRGFKSGGFNGRANSAAEVSTFDPEFVWTYEAGVKINAEDKRWRIHADVFHSDYKDFQARVSEVQNPGAPIPTFAFPVLNAAKLKIDGAELEGNALIGDATQASLQVGYLDARYDSFIDPRVVVNPALAHLHDHVPFSPKWTARLALGHTLSLDNGCALTLGTDVSWRDDTWLSVDNRDVLMQDAYTLVGAFAVLDSADGKWQGRIGVRNLTDRTYKTDAQEFSSVGNIQTAYYGQPRNYYLSLRYNF